MAFNGFTNDDFDVFSIDGLEQRMEALKTNVRPKLEFLGNHFAPTLATMLGEEIFPHVAKHARRTINPPNDTWVAFANNPRGYKMLPHFQIGLWGTHLFIWFAIIYEAPNKLEFGKTLEKNINTIYDDIPEDFVWSLDHMKPEVLKHNELSIEDLTNMFVRLQTVKKAEILCGYQIPRNQAVQLSGQQLLDKIDTVFNTVSSLYKML
ncbi:YktB family protein [Niallia sp. Krafla_26]|uniref:YktB family protein n=1 Tax=Niallia sp. Krafla_26 TaxID=3064703 RepID=UPI003D16CC9A